MDIPNHVMEVQGGSGEESHALRRMYIPIDLQPLVIPSLVMEASGRSVEESLSQKTLYSDWFNRLE
jgi:hypothetical protein